MKQNYLLLLLTLLSSTAFAQTITGRVTSSVTNEGLPGVVILVKGSTTGTSTDTDGNFRISAGGNSTLVVSSIGYKSIEVAVGGRSVVNIALEEDAALLSEVVVTALGVSREQKALGYATTTVQANDITRVGATNVANALYARAPGVRIASTPGGATSPVSIQIRGVNSITGRNQPLIILDGVPIRSEEVANNNYWGDQRIRGNGLNDINPEDIENISILKGASAAALYGSEAVNGVVLITTKSGAKGKKGFSLDFNTNYTVDRIAYLPRFQTVRGAGAPIHVQNLGQDAEGFIYYDTNGDGIRETRGITGSTLNFGPKFDGKPVMAWDGVIRPFEAQPNRYKSLFQDAHSSQVNLAIAQSTERANVRFSLTRQDNGALSLNARNARNIANLNSSYTFSKHWKTDLVVNYINQNTQNRPYSIDRMINNFGGMMGTFDNGEWYRNKYQTSRGYRFVTGNGESLTPEENIRYTGFRADLLDYMWRVNRHQSEERSNRVIGNLTNHFQITNDLRLRARIATDFTSARNEERIATERPLAFGPSGSFSAQNELNTILYGDLLLTYSKKLTENINMQIMGGYTANRETYTRTGVSTNGGLSTENMFDISASFNQANASLMRRERVIDAVLGTVNFDYKNVWFIEGTIRRDRTSTMNPNNNSFTYPSVNTSFILSQAFDMPKFVTYSKIRGSWGVVGNYPDIYGANIAYNQNTLGVQTQGGQPVIFTTISSNFGNDGIRPEMKYGLEFGFENKFFNNRLGLDISYYNDQIRDQILPLTLPNSSGASSVLTNIGTLRNKGVEISLSGSVIKSKTFNWDVIVNYAWNRNIVEKLANNATELLHANYDGGAALLKSVVGRPMGDFYTPPIELHSSGQPIVQPNGLYKLDPNKFEYTGNAMPKAIGGILNSLNYKNLSLDISTDYRIGGHIMPTGLYWMTSRGLTQESLNFMDKESGGLSYYRKDGRGIQTTAERGPNGEQVFHDGMLMQGVLANGEPNTNVISQAFYYWNTYNWGGPQYSSSRYSLYVNEATYVKLRELSLAYRVPARIASKIGASNLQLSVFGRNLFFFYRTIKDIDPEVLTAGSRWAQTVNNAGTNPATRSVGIMLRSSF
ncbi:MAG: SusC/RagA family TonB-linked outer membrane protein [Runella sp.]